MGDAAAISRFVDTVEKRFGRVDNWRTWTDQLLMSTVYFAKEVLPRMQKRNWGRFLRITSYSVKQPVEGLLLSNLLRAVVTGVMRTLANEFGQYGITVNNICPGYTRTDRLDDLAGMMAERNGAKTEEIFEGWKNLIPLGRLGKPEEFAAAVAFLASERASYIHDVSLTVDGGTTRSLF